LIDQRGDRGEDGEPSRVELPAQTIQATSASVPASSQNCVVRMPAFGAATRDGILITESGVLTTEVVLPAASACMSAPLPAMVEIDCVVMSTIISCTGKIS
jgi:hypothetical protein